MSFMLSWKTVGSQSLQQGRTSDWKQTPVQFSDLK